MFQLKKKQRLRNQILQFLRDSCWCIGSTYDIGGLLFCRKRLVSNPHTHVPVFINSRGETDSGYSKPLRHLELLGALEAEIIDDLASDQTINMEFVNALNYTGPVTMANISIDDYNEAMQYVNFDYQGDDGIQVSRDAMIKAVGRCSLIHALYEIIAVADSLNELAPLAIEDGGFADMYKESGHNENATWCFRARKYGDLPDDDAVGKDMRFGARARSMKMEKDGLIALTDLLIKFGGKVDLLDPDCKIYIFGGLTGNERVLARRIAVGPKVCLWFDENQMAKKLVLRLDCRGL